MPLFRALMKEVIQQYGGTQSDLAKAIGMTKGHFSHLCNTPGIFPSVEVCLRLATATGLSASKILRAAGKGAIADEIEANYGAPRRRMPGHVVRATPHEERTLIALRLLDPVTRRRVLGIIEDLSKTTKPVRKFPLPPAAER